MFGIDDFIAGGMQLIGTQMTNQANAKQARAQMDFQERMSGSAHQREVADLRAAGLNPILSGTGGMGASTPGGAQASMQNVIGSAGQAMRENRVQSANVKVAEGTAKVLEHNEREAESKADMADFERRIRDAARHNVKDGNYIQTEAERMVAESRAGSTAATLERELDESSGELLRALKRLGIQGGSAAQVLQLLRAPRREYSPRR